ncbi:vWA domain-containing protein [Corynebacterium freiburgense]|uniref:vWA domain-containing protein n=1 Tax=Corynebacterium freiburgense TaxID=556548 RepID=UPI0006867563|nr:VWA domain-containing protein [Corynebacterium freiburgense]WJZ01837.1 von Willebrand factor type A domain protein [Corynebacterium freiburgense]
MSFRTVFALCSVLFLLPGCSAFKNEPPTVLVFDASSSMLINDANGLRVNAAKAAARTLIDSLPTKTELGIVAYGQSVGDSPAERGLSCEDVSLVRTLQPIKDPANAYNSIGSITPRGWTPLAKAIEKAVSQLPPDIPANVIVLSDGIDTCDGDFEALANAVTHSHPKVRIDAVTFKEDAHHLASITAATGGISVTADNQEQLTRRLHAFRDEALHEALNGNGMNSINLGEHIDQIQQNNPDFPDLRCDESTCTVTFKKSDYIFVDKTLHAIEPNNATTIDGIVIGDSIDKAIGYWGDPVQQKDLGNGTTEYLFPVGSTNSWKVIVEQQEITSITLCRCNPDPKVPAEQQGGDIAIGATLGELPEGLDRDHIVTMGNFYGVKHSSGVFILAENTDTDPLQTKVSHVLPFNRDNDVAFKNRQEADEYFGPPEKYGVKEDKEFAVYSTNNPEMFFAVQWLPGKEGNIDILPLRSAAEY